MRKKETIYVIPASVLEKYAKAYYLVEAMGEDGIFDTLDDGFIADYIDNNFPDKDYFNLDDVVKHEDMLYWKSINAKDCYEREDKKKGSK